MHTSHELAFTVLITGKWKSGVEEGMGSSWGVGKGLVELLDKVSTALHRSEVVGAEQVSSHRFNKLVRQRVGGYLLGSFEGLVHVEICSVGTWGDTLGAQADLVLLGSRGQSVGLGLVVLDWLSSLSDLPILSNRVTIEMQFLLSGSKSVGVGLEEQMSWLKLSGTQHFVLLL